MQILTEPVRAPEFRAAPPEWLNSEPLAMANLRGRVVLIDFWDYTCINCLHTLPYLREWHRRYVEAGLVLVGVHAPEFHFAHEPERVQDAIRRFQIPYPVVLDNQFRLWNAYANRAWPAKYLLDGRGYVRAFHHGEGEYQAFERQIQRLLHEINPALQFPEPLPPVRAIDEPGAACYRPTPELYLGYKRGRFGNLEGNPPGQIIHYSVPAEPLAPDTVYLQGEWLNGPEFVEAQQAGATVSLEYSAAEVNAVLSPPENQAACFQLYLDGLPVPEENRGEDVALLDGQTVISLDAPRMARLLRHDGFERHRLTLTALTPGARIYAFTFVGCVLSPNH